MDTLLTGSMSAAANLAVAGVFVGFWMLNRSARWNLLWGISHAALALAVLGNASAPYFPALPVQLVSALAGGGIAALVAGVVALNGRGIAPRYLIAAILLLGAVLFGLNQVRPDAGKLLALLILCGSFVAAGILLMRRPESPMRLVGWLLLLRGGYFIVYAWLMVQGHEALAQVIGHFFALSTALGLLFVAFIEHNRSLNEAQREIAGRNVALQQRETELIQANQRLADMAARLEERNLEYVEARDRALAADRAKTHFLHHMSHELRTPLNAVIGFSELMLAQPGATPRPPRDAENLQHIGTAGRRLLGILSDILEFASIDLQAVELEPARVDVAGLLADTLTQLKVAADGKQIDIACETAPGLTAWLDRRLARQALLNVIGSAIKHTPNGGRIRIDTRLLANRHCEFRVSDGGPGLDDQAREQIFEPFWQNADVFSRDQGGVGLHLSTARRLVEILGGQIRAEIAAPSGTCIIIDLPPGPGAAGENAA